VEPEVPGEVAVEWPALAGLRTRRAGALRAALREALAHLSDADALILRLHFLQGLAIARVASLLGLAQKPLYRRVERLLQALRARLEQAGFTSAEVGELLGDPAFEHEEDFAAGACQPA
jgi:DNA-directed RNA polymerase specialized sigma24 family protein